MVEVALETKKQELAIEKQDVSVLISDEVFLPLMLQLPPTAELHEIRKLSFSKVSPEEIYRYLDQSSKGFFRIERDHLLKKYDRYKESPTFLSHLATLTEFSGDLTGMVDFLRGGARVDSTDFHINRLGRTLIALNSFPEAAKAFGTADLKADAEANLGLACLAILRGDYGQAFDFVNAALDIDGTNFNALLLAGLLELSTSQMDKAIRYFRSATEERSNSSAPYLLLGAPYYRTGRRDKALDMLKRAVAINPVDENAVILYADTLFMEQRYEEVIRVLEDFTRFEQKSIAAWDRLGRAFYHLSKNSDALNAFKHQASILENSCVWNNIALVYWRMGDNKRAWNHLSLALSKTIGENFPSFLPLYNTFIFLRNRGSLDEAIKVTATVPKDRLNDLLRTKAGSNLLVLRFEALVELGHLEEAERELDVLLRTKDIHRELHISLLQSATFFYSLAKPEMRKALYYAQLALDELNKGDVEDERRSLLLNNVIFVLLEFGKIDEANKLVAKLSSWIHKSAAATATLGLMHLRKGHLEAGKRLYKEAISMSANPRMKSRFKTKMQLEVGRLLLERGQLRAAAGYLKEAATSDLKGISGQAVDLLKTLAR